MQGVIVIGEPYKNSIFIEAVEFPDGTRRTTHFTQHHGIQWANGHTVDKYVIYFDDDNDNPVNLYQLQDSVWRGFWFLDD